MFQCNILDAATPQTYQPNWRRRLARGPARVSRTVSLSATHEETHRCANARNGRDCLRVELLTENTYGSSTYLWRRERDSNPHYASCNSLNIRAFYVYVVL